MNKPQAAEGLDATSLAKLIKDGDITAAEAVGAAIDRCKQINGKINAVISTRFDKALEQAKNTNHKRSGVLAGVPFLTKDLGFNESGEPGYEGNRVLKAMDYHSTFDCHAAVSLRAAGLISIGRTNVPEFGCGNCAASCENEAFGSTKNPWDLKRTAMGSSGGSAAAVAGGIVPLAHGSDGGGSIRMPASACGIVGLKATRGRVSNAPFGETWNGSGTTGMLTRTIRDAALSLDILSGLVAGDHYTAPKPERPFLDEIGTDPGKLRIGLCKQNAFGRIDQACVDAVDQAGTKLESLGHHIEYAYPKALFEQSIYAPFGVIFLASTRTWLDGLKPLIGRDWKEEDMENGTWLSYIAGKDITATNYLNQVAQLGYYNRQMAQWWEGEDAYDILVTPTLATLPPKLGYLVGASKERQTRLAELMPYTEQFNISGQPAISLPLHWSDEGLPVGVQFVAKFANEALLIRLSSQLEQVYNWINKTPPIFSQPEP